MKRGIQIDDRVDALSTNASCKILLKNNREVKWNKYEGDLEGNVYIAICFRYKKLILRIMSEYELTKRSALLLSM